MKPAEFGIIVKGMVTGTQETKKGKFIHSITLGDTLIKVLSETNGLKFGDLYHASCSMFNELFMEKTRLPV
jgi:hypothetical protein